MLPNDLLLHILNFLENNEKMIFASVLYYDKRGLSEQQYIKIQADYCGLFPSIISERFTTTASISECCKCKVQIKNKNKGNHARKCYWDVRMTPSLAIDKEQFKQKCCNYYHAQKDCYFKKVWECKCGLKFTYAEMKCHILFCESMDKCKLCNWKQINYRCMDPLFSHLSLKSHMDIYHIYLVTNQNKKIFFYQIVILMNILL